MESFFCSDCGKQYSLEKKLKKHQRVFHSNELYKGEECGKEVEGAKKNWKPQEDTYYESLCDIVFPITSLSNHMKGCSSNAAKEPISCDQCDYKTSLKHRW